MTYQHQAPPTEEEISSLFDDIHRELADQSAALTEEAKNEIRHFRMAYRAEIHPKWYRSLRSRNMSKTKVAEEFGINRTTLHDWLDKYQEMQDAERAADSGITTAMFGSLVNLALGCEIEETKVVSKKGEEDEVTVTTKRARPDYRALIKILEAKLPDVFGKNEVEQDSTISRIEIEVVGNGSNSKD